MSDLLIEAHCTVDGFRARTFQRFWMFQHLIIGNYLFTCTNRALRLPLLKMQCNLLASGQSIRNPSRAHGDFGLLSELLVLQDGGKLDPVCHPTCFTLYIASWLVLSIRLEFQILLALLQYLRCPLPFWTRSWWRFIVTFVVFVHYSHTPPFLDLCLQECCTTRHKSFPILF